MCAPRVKNQVAQACPSVPQAGRMTQYLWVHRHKILSTANILWLNIFTVLPPYKRELDESHWHKYMLPAPKRAVLHSNYLGHTWEVLHCQQISENFCPLPQTKTYYNSRDSFREHSLKGSPKVTSSLPSFLLGLSPNTTFINRRY